MTESIQIFAIIATAGLMLVAHRAGAAHSVRTVGNFWYALAHAIEHFRAEFRRLNGESRKCRDYREVAQ